MTSWGESWALEYFTCLISVTHMAWLLRWQLLQPINSITLLPICSEEMEDFRKYNDFYVVTHKYSEFSDFHISSVYRLPWMYLIWFLRNNWHIIFYYTYLDISRYLKNLRAALAGVGQWVGPCPTKQKVAGLIPGQGTCLGCGPGPHLGHMPEATDWCFSLTLTFLFLSFPLHSPLPRK